MIKPAAPIWVSLHDFDGTEVLGYKSEMKYVKLELEIDERDVLVSDFNEWSDYVLNDLCIKDNANEEDLYLFAEDYGLDKDNFKRSSWEKIFYPDRERIIEDSEDIQFNDRMLQGVTGKVVIQKVKKIEHFIAK